MDINIYYIYLYILLSLKGEREQGQVIKRKLASLSSPTVANVHLILPSLPNRVLFLYNKTFDLIKGLNCQIFSKHS